MSVCEQSPHQEQPPSPEKSTRPDISSGEYLPKRILTNDEIASWQMVRSNKGKLLSAADIEGKVGTRSRHIASPEETPLKMGLEAAQEAYGNKPGKIDAVIVTTNFPTGQNLSGEIAKEFGITGFNMDFYAGCAGFGLVLHYIREREDQFLGKRVLFVDTQKIHDHLRDLRENTGEDGKPIDKALQQTIFTDGAYALLVDEYGSDMRVIFSKPHRFSKDDNEALKMPVERSLARKPYIIYRAPYAASGTIEQDGPRVYKLMCNTIPQLVRDDLQITNLRHSDIRRLDIHQASGPTVEGIIQRLPEYEIARDCKDGNPSSGSLIKAYRKAHLSNDILIGDKRSFAVFGAGLLAVIGVVEFGH